MPKVKHYFWIFTFILLTSCQLAIPSPTQEPTVIPPTITLTSSNTSIPTVTHTPTKTKTPTITMTPSESAVPRPDYYRGLPAGLVEAVLVTDEQIKLIEADALVDRLQLNESYPPYHGYSIGPYLTSAERGANIFCLYGESCAVYTLIQKKNPFGGDNIYLFIWKFRDPDGTIRVVEHELVTHYIDENTAIAQEDLRRMLRAKKGTGVILVVITHVNSPENSVDPAFWSTANGAPKEKLPILGELEKGPKVFPDGIENVPLTAGITVLA